jgi:hypothetical protein
MRAASRANDSGGFSSKNSGPSRPPPPAPHVPRRGHYGDAQGEERPHVFDQQPGGGGQAHALGLLGERDDHAVDARIKGARGAIGALDQRNPRGQLQLAHGAFAVAALDRPGRDGLRRQHARARCDVGGRVGGARHGGRG